MSENHVVVYHYKYSPFAKRLIWYLTLRGIKYTECIQPPIMPRPDLAMLGVNYRRIPVMAIGRDIYCDTRLQLEALDAHFPPSERLPFISAKTPEHIALQLLLSKFMIDGGVFAQGARLLPVDLPLMQDPKFQKDRHDFSGRAFDKKAIEQARPEALAHVRDAMIILEESLLSDGRQWILDTEKPMLADIEAVWLLHWLAGMKGALDSDVVNASLFPKVFSYIARFDSAIKAAAKAQEKPTVLKGPAAAQVVLRASYVEKPRIDIPDPLRFKQGDVIEAWPVDTGFNHRDVGTLVGLDRRQVVIERKCEDGSADVRIHFPRVGFRFRKQAKSNL